MDELIKVAVASFVAGITGSIVGAATMVISMRVDIRWLKREVAELKQEMKDELAVAHGRITKLKEATERVVNALRKRIEDTRDIVLKNIP
ncbi:MAG TPA: hypothetical protein VK973_05930 [Arenicellales bacterium]|nr:hypothetical protein [Arenicellales bacterium]